VFFTYPRRRIAGRRLYCELINFAVQLELLCGSQPELASLFPYVGLGCDSRLTIFVPPFFFSQGGGWVVEALSLLGAPDGGRLFFRRRSNGSAIFFLLAYW